MADTSQWSDWLGEQTCTPIAKTQPTSLDQLVATINNAGGKKQRVRAVGSGHSTSDITRTDGAILIDPHQMAAIMDFDTTTLNQRASGTNLIRVQSGILIKDLNQQLDERGLALVHMPAYDGQTISGAMSTGTHGSGAKWGPMASMLRSIVMVVENGTVFQIEPASGAITDPSKFPGTLPEAPGIPVILLQNDDWFHAAQVSMGCLGVIYSYTIEVTAAFHVSENRTAVRWEDIKSQFAPEAFNPLPAPLAHWDHFELVVSPYTSGDDDKHPCIWVERARVGNTAKRGARQDFWGRILEDVGILFTGVLDDILNIFPRLAPSSINTAMESLTTDDAPYIDSSYTVFKVLDSELELRAHAIELHFPAENLVATIDKLMATFQTIADQKNLYVAGPVGIRFVAASDALLAPQTGQLTATAEMSNIVGIKKGEELLQDVKSAMSSADGSIRVHWGLDLDTVTAQDARDWYGANLDNWLNVYREANANGMFNNRFTERIGITV
ncbi:FAD-dependent oxidoreductase [Diaporthe sp. PMI_573]|nr:FAD-dependent oxidoreductase [Diaporthaceae sp. PMI_573]